MVVPGPFIPSPRASTGIELTVHLLQGHVVNIHGEMRMDTNLHQGPELPQIFILHNPYKSLPFIQA